MRGALALIACVASPALAADPLYGTWCGPQEVMFVDAGGILFNEHTVCDVMPSPALTHGIYEAGISCRNVYVIGDALEEGAGPFTTREVPLPDITRIKIRAQGADRVTMMLDTMEDPTTMDRCD